MDGVTEDGKTLRIAVIGAGPAGIYLAEALCSQAELPIAVDVYDRLPTPMGLLRYGVAPDHLKMKNLSTTLQKALELDQVRFIGNVNVGTDVTIPELLADYHAVAYAYGAAVDRKLGIPGEDLPGSLAATHFVNWYSGHPDIVDDVVIDAKSAIVIGLGNVALDVARVLARHPDEMATTDIPDNVLRQLRGSAISDVHIVGRRGPDAAKFTIKELREMGQLAGVDVVVDAADVADLGEIEAKEARRNVEVMTEWSTRTPTGAPRRVIMHFHSRPLEILGTDRVEGIRLERPDGSTYEIEGELVLRSVGYLGTPLPGVPFDAAHGVIPVVDHRVQGGTVEVGEYACGWIQRGPTGVIGTNRSDAKQAAATILADRDTLLARETTPGSVLDLLRERGVNHVLLDGWNAIDAAEVARGSSRDNARIKISVLEELLAAAADSGRA
jgi:ferredoxin--NADP+ reductase